MTKKTDKITFNNNGYKTQYIIDEANKKVTCYMETDLETVFKKLYKMLHNRDHEGSYSFVRARLRYGKKNILYGVGVAQCKGDDVFNRTIGMDIAREQAIRMIYEAKMQDIDRLLHDCDAIKNMIIGFKSSIKKSFPHRRKPC